MHVVDILIIVFIIIFAVKGFINGAIHELVSFVGGFLVIVIAFILKNPLSVFLYQKLPFFKFGGIFSGLSVFNIIIYELISFLIVASILLLVYRIIVKISNIFETILKITIILEIPSKIIGLFIGAVEGLVFVFIALFIAMQFKVARDFMSDGKYIDLVLTKTPVLSNATKSLNTSVDEIYDVAEKYKDSKDRNQANLEALQILLKYKIISPDNAENLVKSGKLNIKGSDTLIEKYKLKEVEKWLNT